MPRVLTNKFGLPDIIVKAIQYDTYFIGGDLSASTLLDSPRIAALKKKHTYTEDVSDMLDALLGTSLHHVLERATINNARKSAFNLTMETLMEHYKKVQDEEKKASMLKVITYLKKYSDAAIKIDERYETEMTLRWEVDGIVIYGTRDLYDNITKYIEDYKSTKTWAWTFPESQLKWKQQLNIYAYLAIMNGYEVKGLIINAFFKDWSKSNLNRTKDYPPQKIMRIPVKLDPIEVMTEYVHERVAMHKKAMAGDLPLCTGTERWASANQYAVKTPGVKKSLKNFDEKDFAEKWLLENRHRLKNPFIEIRPGESRRCAEYCPVAQFCDQRKAE